MDNRKEITSRLLLLKDEVIAKGECRNASDFADSIGEYKQNFSLMEKGLRHPTVEHLAKACLQYGYSANWLLLNIGPKKMDKGQNTTLESRVNDLEVKVNALIRAKKKSNPIEQPTL